MWIERMDDIYSRVPVDRVAVWVAGPGEHFNPTKRVQANDSEEPIATRPARISERNADGFLDLTGQRVGRFMVLGLARDFARQWVVRCDCGRYSTRHAKAIKNPANTQDRCEHCRHLAFLKRDERWRRTGRDVDIRDF